MKPVLNLTAKTAVSALVALLFSLPAYSAEYLVKYRNNLNIVNFANYKTMQVLDVNTTASLMKVNVPDHSKIQALTDLYSNPNVQYVVPNIKLHTFSAPVQTTALKTQWAIQKVQAEKAWTRAGNKGSKNVIVAVIDTGVDYNHKNLAPNMMAGYDFAKNTNDPMDKTGAQNPGHGTHCAGIIGATGVVEDGTVGLSPEVTLMPLRFLTENGSGDLNNAIKAIDYAIEKGARVISASWGASVPRATAEPLIEAIGRAEAAGVIFVVAAANDGKNNDKTEVYPTNAGNSNTIAVAASNSSDAKPSWSNYGRAKVHVSAPGDAIMSTLPGNKYDNLSGTSMATPLVSGLVALILAQDPSLKPLQVRSLLQMTGAQVAIETACACRVDAFNAIDTVKAQNMFISPAAGTFAKGDKVSFEAVYGKAPFSFVSSNTATATIDASGEMTAVADGETQITVTDANGKTSQSLKIYVGAKASDPGNPGNPGDPGDPGMECPLGDPMLCEVICGIVPDLPWCAAN